LRSILAAEILRGMSWRNVQLARRCFARFAAGDLDGFLELMDSDVEWVPAIEVMAPDELIFGTYRGHDGIRQWFADVQRFNDYRVESDTFRGTDDYAYVTGKVFIEDDGQTFLRDVYFVFTIRAGKVAAAHTYLDEAEALEAAGLSG